MSGIMNELRAVRKDSPKITVIGVGGGGGNAVNHMFEEGISGVTFMVCNTDQQALDNSPVSRKIVMGSGLGAGNIPEIAFKAAMGSMEEIKNELSSPKPDMLFITAGMGGGTGTGASPVVARVARELGILTVAIVTMPKSNEGKRRRRQAEEGIHELKQYIDSILVIENDNIAKIYGKDSLYDGFRRADEVLTKAAKGIAELITIHGRHNVDLPDVRTTLENSGRVHFSVATASGPNRIADLIDKSLYSPLLEQSITGARRAIVNLSAASFTGDNNVTQEEFDLILNAIREAAGVEEDGTDLELIWGTTEKPELGDELELVLVAANFKDNVGSEQRVESVESGTPVMLGSRPDRYSDIASKLDVPAYQRRNFDMITESAGTRGSSESSRPRSKSKPSGSSKYASQGISLFGDDNDN